MPKSEHSSRLLDSCRDFLNRAERRRHEKREALEARYLGKKKAFTLCCLLAYDEKYAIGPVDYPTNLVRDKIIEESARRMREITREENFLTICYPALYAVLKHPLCNLTHAQKINAVARWLRSFRSGRAKYVQQLVEEVLPIQQKMKLKHRIEANFAFGFNSDVYKFYLLNWL